MSKIKELKQPETKSKSYIIEILRGIINVAIKEKILFLEISYTTEENKKLRSFTVGDSVKR